MPIKEGAFENSAKYKSVGKQGEVCAKTGLDLEFSERLFVTFWPIKK